MFSGREKTFACLVLLFAASAVSACPTIISANPCPITPSSSDLAADNVSFDLGYSGGCDQISEFANAYRQPKSSDSWSTAQRRLPAVPPAVAMALTGFICISLVRDRKSWIALLAGLVAIGQVGVNALPERSSRLSRKVHDSRLIEPTPKAFCLHRSDFHPANYTNETRYTGLLHHLAGIHCNIDTFTNNRTTLIRHFSGAGGKVTRISKEAVCETQLVLSELSNCLVHETGQFVCFSQIFSFNLIPRGPPVSV
ncbi:MAG: hypothetical protein ABII09_09795 [Planctomycetota bacterium]